MLTTRFNASTPEYGAAIAELQQKTVDRLAKAGGREDALHDAILSYLREGYRIGATRGELIDFFCVSTPNIVESAGYRDGALDAIVRLFDALHARLWREMQTAGLNPG